MAKANAWMAAMALASVGLHALLWVAWDQHWGWLDIVDSPALNTLHAFGVRHPGWVTGWDVFCTVLGPNAFRLIGLVAVAYAMVRRRWRIVGFLFASIELSGPRASLAKSLADRPRPSTALVTAPSSSFPSGHAVGVMVGVLALLTVLLPHTNGWQTKGGARRGCGSDRRDGRRTRRSQRPSSLRRTRRLGTRIGVSLRLPASPRTPSIVIDT